MTKVCLRRWKICAPESCRKKLCHKLYDLIPFGYRKQECYIHINNVYNIIDMYTIVSTQLCICYQVNILLWSRTGQCGQWTTWPTGKPVSMPTCAIPETITISIRRPISLPQSATYGPYKPRHRALLSKIIDVYLLRVN